MGRIVVVGVINSDRVLGYVSDKQQEEPHVPYPRNNACTLPPRQGSTVGSLSAHERTRWYLQTHLTISQLISFIPRATLSPDDRSVYVCVLFTLVES